MIMMIIASLYITLRVVLHFVFNREKQFVVQRNHTRNDDMSGLLFPPHLTTL